MRTYGEAAARKILDVSDLGESGNIPLVVVTPNGVSPIGGIETILQWKPCCELDGLDAPDALEAPGLPIPFAANELAAFMIDGVGAFIAMRFGEWEDGPDEEILSAMGIQANQAREAVRAAFGAYRDAERVVGRLDKELGAECQRLAEEHNQKNLEANDREHIWEPGISDDEYRLRRGRAKDSNAELRARASEVQTRWNFAEAAWRKAMVKELLRPATDTQFGDAPDESDIATLDLRAGYVETGLNGTAINWRYWVEQLPTLTAAQAARLMSGLEPDNFENLDSRPGKDDPSKHCAKARKIERLAIAEGKLEASQRDWISWADERRFSVNLEFRRAVEAVLSATQADVESPVTSATSATPASGAPMTMSERQSSITDSESTVLTVPAEMAQHRQLPALAIHDYLSFAEVGGDLGCAESDVRRLVIESKKIRTVRITPNGLLVEPPFDELDFNDDLSDDGTIMSRVYELTPEGTKLKSTIHAGHLRVERSELVRFQNAMDLSAEAVPATVDKAAAPVHAVLADGRNPSKLQVAPRWPLQIPPPVATQTPPGRTAKLSVFRVVWDWSPRLMGFPISFGFIFNGCLASEARQAVGIGRGAVGRPRTP